MEELRLFALQQEHGSSGVGERNATESMHGKRKSVANLVDEESPAKRQKDSVEKPKKARKKEKGQLRIETKLDKVQESKEAYKASSADEQEKKPTSDKVRSYTDQCTVFISNLDLKASIFGCYKNWKTRAFFPHTQPCMKILIMKYLCRQVITISRIFSMMLEV